MIISFHFDRNFINNIKVTLISIKVDFNMVYEKMFWFLVKSLKKRNTRSYSKVITKYLNVCSNLENFNQAFPKILEETN